MTVTVTNRSQAHSSSSSRRIQIRDKLRPSRVNVSGRTKIPLYFEELQSRIGHIHLALDETGELAFHVDRESRVVRVSPGQVSFLYSLIGPIG